MPERRAPRPLTIAGSDPSGGAGIAADLKVFAAFGLSGMAIPTALTIQTTARLHALGAVDARHFARTLATLLRDEPPDGVKVGLVPGALLPALGRALRRFEGPLVIDPVLASSSGRRVLARADRRVLLETLLPRATVVTPNRAEAAWLLGWDPARVARDPEGAIAALCARGLRAVLLKGGHGGGARATDRLGTADGRRLVLDAPRRRARARVHGTGCALSAALLCGLLRGRSLERAAADAKAFVGRAIAGARPRPGGVHALDFFA